MAADMMGIPEWMRWIGSILPALFLAAVFVWWARTKDSHSPGVREMLAILIGLGIVFALWWLDFGPRTAP